MRFRLGVAALACGLLANGSSALQGQRLLSSTPVVKVLHLKGKVTAPPYTDSVALTAEVPIDLRREQSVSIVLAYRNPFLFTYQTEASERETEQHKIAASFAKSLLDFGKQFHAAGGAAGGVPNKVVIEGLDVRAVLASFNALEAYLADIPKEITKSISENPTDLKNVKEAVGFWKVDDHAKQVEDAVKPARAIVLKCASGNPDLTMVDNGVTTQVKCGANAAADLGPIKDIAQAIVSLEPGTTASVATLREFAEDASHLGEEVDLGTAASSISDKVFAVTATPVTKYQRFFEDVAKKKQSSALKKFTFVVRTYSPVMLSLGPALILRSGETPAYGTQTVPGGFQIVRTDEEGKAVSYNLAAMLNIIPRRWYTPSFNPFFQVGVNPAKDQLGLYAGAGMTIQGVFSLGAGLVGQQVPTLDRGLAENQIISAPELLKTHPGFKRGPYVTLTVTLPK